MGRELILLGLNCRSVLILNYHNCRFKFILRKLVRKLLVGLSNQTELSNNFRLEVYCYDTASGGIDKG